MDLFAGIEALVEFLEIIWAFSFFFQCSIFLLLLFSTGIGSVLILEDRPEGVDGRGFTPVYIGPFPRV